MSIQKLALVHFRHSQSASYQFAPGLNVITGPNGAGKTSLLEAITLGLTSSSFRTRSLFETVHFGQSRAQLQLLLQEDAWQECIRVEITERSKSVSLNGKAHSSLQGHFPVICWLPQDIELIHGGPKARRAYLDQLLVVQDPLYLYQLRRLHQVVKQKNSALKQKHHASIAPLNEQLCLASHYVSSARAALATMLEPLMNHVMKKLRFAGAHALLLKSSGTKSLAALKQEVDSALKQELLQKTSLKGAHLDELDILFCGESARKFASQGQARCLVAALKVAQVELLKGHAPWLLIDELGMGLDQERLEATWELMQGWKQAFVTMPKLDDERQALLKKAPNLCYIDLST